MEIKINEKVIDTLKNVGFYPDEMFSLYFALKALDEKESSLLDRYDDLNSSKRAVIVYQNLFRKGLIEKSEGGNAYFTTSQKGRDLLESLKILSENTDVKVEEEPKKDKYPTAEEWIEEWINLFPLKSGNRLLRGDKKSCLSKMNTFLKAYKYDKELIFQATKSYLMEQSTSNFKYTKNAVYFINKKDEGSQLAAWCKTVEDKINAGGSADDGSHVVFTDIAN